MGLQGALKDFGLADIFSVIGTQNRTGTLTVISRDERVTLCFNQGALVRSQATRRAHQDLLGAMLLRAEAIKPQDLQAALENQKSSQRRLGILLLEQGAISQKQLDAFTKLQSTETVFRVFLWRGGTYEFAPSDTPLETAHAPVRADALLVEGFRQADAWPVIRRKVISYAMTFAQVAELPSATGPAGGRRPTGTGDGAEERMRHIGPNERSVYALVIATRDVQNLIDLSRLGEFETCMALVRLCEAGFLAAKVPRATRPSAEASVGGIATPDIHAHVPTGRLALGGATALGLWLWVLLGAGLSPWATHTQSSARYLAMPLERTLGRAAYSRLTQALRVHRAVRGTYPEQLSALLTTPGIAQWQLHFPWQEAYFYVRHDQSYELHPPLY